MKRLKSYQSGFTIVELVVVITVIAILAALSTMAYRSYIHQTDYARISADMQKLNLAIEKYYAKNGSYPAGSVVGNWARRGSNGQDFIVGLRPEYMATVPDVETGNKADKANNTFIYLSDGRDYKLLRLAAAGQSIPDQEIQSVPADMRDPTRWGAGTPPQYRAWGYWTAGYANR